MMKPNTIQGFLAKHTATLALALGLLCAWPAGRLMAQPPLDTIPPGSPSKVEGDLTLEHNLTFPVPGPGRLQFFPAADEDAGILADCLTTPTSMVLDRSGNRVIITEMATGRLVALELR